MSDKSDKKEKPRWVAIIISVLTSLFSMLYFLVGAGNLGASNIIGFGHGEDKILGAGLLISALFGFFSGAMLFFKGGKTSKVFVGLFWILTIIIFGLVVADLMQMY